jgi:hypothetical protein
MRWSKAQPAALNGTSVMGDAGFSAVGWYFARAIQPHVNGAAVGLVMATMGGTALESWMSAKLLYGPDGGTAGSKGVCPVVSGDPSTDIPGNSFSPPTSNYNGQIVPLTGMTVQAVVWYQGKTRWLFLAANISPHLST